MLSPVFQYFVALQPLLRVRPSGHASQDAAPALEYVPSPHCVHAVLPTRPPAQHVHLLLPVVLLKEPAGHGRQAADEFCPARGLYVPAGHERHV
jgi:hypothetical protein